MYSSDPASRGVDKNRVVSVGSVTLTANTTTTTIDNLAVGLQSHVFLSPQTANAAAALATTYWACTRYTITFTHANNAQTDRIFSYIVVAGDL